MEKVRKWQNILENRCPDCGLKFFEKKFRGDTFHNCPDDDCAFGISESHFVDMLMRPEHPIHQFATVEQQDLIQQIIELNSK